MNCYGIGCFYVGGGRCGICVWAHARQVDVWILSPLDRSFSVSLLIGEDGDE